jgi:tetratricopeptide (TPR) repeat protein
MALELDPDDCEALQSRSEAYEQIGDYPSAMADRQRAIEIDPSMI